MTPAERAEELVVPWKEGMAGHGFHAILDDAELRRRVAALIEEALKMMDKEMDAALDELDSALNAACERRDRLGAALAKIAELEEENARLRDLNASQLLTVREAVKKNVERGKEIARLEQDKIGLLHALDDAGNKLIQLRADHIEMVREE